ncbi:MAG: hypothetical protein ACW99E_21810 [Promethearchaeota archaeon]
MGYIFRKTLNFIGTTCLTFGGIITIFSIVRLFLDHRINTKWFIMGIVLLWIGSWCTGIAINLFGIQIGRDNTSVGYHFFW